MKKTFVALPLLPFAFAALDAYAGDPAPVAPAPSASASAAPSSSVAPPVPPPLASSTAAADFRAMPPPFHSDSKFAFPKIREATLANGVRLFVIERHELPLVSLEVVSDLGTAVAPPAVPMLASDIATSATHGHFSWELDHDFSAIGAYRDAWSDLEGTEILIRFLAPHLARGMELAAEVATDANFSGDLIDKARVVRKDQRHSMTRWPFVELANELYPASHPFHDLAFGSEEAIERASTSDMDAFWKRAFTSNHTAVVVAGDVTFDDVLAHAKSSFGSMRRSGEAAPSGPPAVTPPPRTQVTIVDQPNVAQTHVAVGSIAVERTSPDFFPLEVAVNVLGARTFSGTRQAHGYTYGMRTTLEAHKGTGFVVVDGNVEVGSTERSIRDVMTAVESFAAKPPTDEEIARAKSRLVAGWESSFETDAGAVSRVAALFRMSLPMTEISARNVHVEAVTREEMLAAAAKYLDGRKMHVVIIGDAKELKIELATLGLGPIVVKPAHSSMK